MSYLFDTHCHLDFEDFDADRTEVLERAADGGIRTIMIPGVSREQSLREQVHHHDVLLLYGFGLHPYFIGKHSAGDLDWVAEQLDAHPGAPVGEIGLDATCADYQLQQKLFRAQVEFAAEFQRPLILHHRNSQADLLEVIRPMRDQLPALAGVLHAFSGSAEQAQQWQDLGFKLGVGGTITYERAKKTRDAIARSELGGLVLETDAPDMPVCGRQGKRNEPLCLLEVRQSLLGLRSESEDELDAILWKSSQEVFAGAFAAAERSGRR
ncbi:hypothetical protein IDSA_11830 [Pseudidiomarina salinarum]|uniref:Hydrolase TatD n=1 Tax=Pseudidiomarina salinarum TaxID=435908 RepID=A0A094IWB4_9GAMM|nr:TatD family hydrolase [Pseudidiomarina salinarum]KFZ30134.1 hypothetical protein IDSA_11830 [Pseudidiomarina salinarum]RUO68256.1 TatD family deoxyribonuclease [Pseudidiomarina salinarum]